MEYRVAKPRIFPGGGRLFIIASVVVSGIATIFIVKVKDSEVSWAEVT